MLAILDTNVVISALLAAEGKPAELVRLWEIGEFDVAISSALLDELSRALHYPKIAKRLGMSDEEILSFLNGYLTATTLVSPAARLNVIVEDTDDNQVLECAVAASVAVIVTGDGHLLALKAFQGIEILTPAEFIVYLESSRKK